jgi:murein DD-endopeptidase MepM/ murein hydrolase activator NlpD
MRRPVPFYHYSSKSDKTRRVKKGWIFIVAILTIINIYLFFIRGIPILAEGTESAGKNTLAHPLNERVAEASAEKPHASQITLSYQNTLGEMRGVAGVRSANTVELRSGPRISHLRFDLEEAHGVSGQRDLSQWCEISSDAVGHKETLAATLFRLGLDNEQVSQITRALQGKMDFRHVKEGQRFELLRSPNGRVERFTYQSSVLLSYLVERRDGKFVARKVEEKAEVELCPIALRLEGSLYNSMEQAGESPALVMMLVDIFVWDIDFYLDTHRGDTVRLVVEKRKLNGRMVGYGRILAAEYQGEVGLHRAFWYSADDGPDGYFNEKGGSLRRAFLKSPLKFTRVTSGFGMRVHPILGYSGMHAGIDFGAPLGTPVQAPSDGVVRQAGRNGGAGNMVTLRHANGYETIYMHLSAIAPGVRLGARIRQKQLIGMVGSTGLSTGPHLHYGMRLNGREVNPLGQRFPPAEPIPSKLLPAYQKAIEPLIKQIDAIPIPQIGQTASVTGKQLARRVTMK